MRIKSVLLIGLTALIAACTTKIPEQPILVPPSGAMVKAEAVEKIEPSDGKGVRVSDLAQAYLNLKRQYKELGERHSILIKWVDDLLLKQSKQFK